MGTFRRQFVLVSAVVSAAIIFGSAPVRAGYVSVPAIAEHEGGNSLIHLPGSPLAEFETAVGMGDSAAASQPRPNAEDQTPSGPVSPARKLRQHVAYYFGESSGAGTSSSSAPSTGSSTSPAGDSPRPQIPPLELSSLLPPQTGDAHPFSVSSFLFRPPRVPR